MIKNVEMKLVLKMNHEQRHYMAWIMSTRLKVDKGCSVAFTIENPEV